MKPVTRCSCSAETSGPICVSGANPWPSLIFFASAATPSTTSPKTDFSTNSRDPAQQHCP